MTDPQPEQQSDQQAAPGPLLDRDRFRDLGPLRRTAVDRHVAGVSGGLGRHFGVDPVILRVAFVVLAFFGGAGLLLYGAAWLLVPEEGSDQAAIDLDPRTRTLALGGVAAVGALITVGDSWGFWGFPWPLALLAIVAVIWHRRRQQGPESGSPDHTAPPAAPPAAPYATTDLPPASGTRPFVPGPAGPPSAAGSPPAGNGSLGSDYHWVPPGTPGSTAVATPPAVAPRRRGPLLVGYAALLSLVGVVALAIVDAAGATVAAAAYPALVLAVIGAMLLVASRYGRGGGLILVGIVAALALALTTAADRIEGERRDLAPLAASEIDAEYAMTTGEFVLDLTGVTDLESLDGRTLRIDVSVGRVEVIVPADGLDVAASGAVSGPGHVSIFDGRSGGIDSELDVRHDGGDPAPELTLELTSSIGEIVVRTADQ